MIHEKLDASLVTSFSRFVDLLTSEKMFHSCDQYSLSAAQLSRNTRKASKGEYIEANEPVMVHRDRAFHFVPGSLSQPPRIEFSEADSEVGLGCVVESMRGGLGQFYVDPISAPL